GFIYTHVNKAVVIRRSLTSDFRVGVSIAVGNAPCSDLESLYRSQNRVPRRHRTTESDCDLLRARVRRRIIEYCLSVLNGCELPAAARRSGNCNSRIVRCASDIIRIRPRVRPRNAVVRADSCSNKPAIVWSAAARVRWVRDSARKQVNAPTIAQSINLNRVERCRACVSSFNLIWRNDTQVRGVVNLKPRTIRVNVDNLKLRAVQERCN